MIRVSIEKNRFNIIEPIINSNYYTIRFDIEEHDDCIFCSEDTIVKSKTKESLIKSIVDYKYSTEDVNLILCSKINNEVTPEYTKYLEWLDYAKKCASIIFDAPTLENAIKAKLEEITKYDVSSAVNGFYYQGNEYWLDKDTRVGLMNSTTILKEAGETNTSLWLDNLHIILPVDDVIAKLSQLEVYALECYNVTAQHKVAVSGLQTIEEVKAYDITSGYPTKLDLT
jgi:hypothetical protein